MLFRSLADAGSVAYDKEHDFPAGSAVIEPSFECDDFPDVGVKIFDIDVDHDGQSVVGQKHKIGKSGEVGKWGSGRWASVGESMSRGWRDVREFYKGMAEG